MTSRPNASQTVANVVDNFNGGAPGRNDEVPAIIFCVAVSCTCGYDHAVAHETIDSLA